MAVSGDEVSVLRLPSAGFERGTNSNRRGGNENVLLPSSLKVRPSIVELQGVQGLGQLSHFDAITVLGMCVGLEVDVGGRPPARSRVGDGLAYRSYPQVPLLVRHLTLST